MRVLQICNGYFDTKVYENFFLALEKHNIRNTIFVFLNKNRKVNEISTAKELIVEKCYNSLERIVYWHKQKKVFNKFLISINFKKINLIHAHTVFSNGDIAYRVKKKVGVPYVVTIRNTDINVFFKYIFFLRKHGIKILKEAEKIIFLSPKYEEEFFLRYVKKEEKEELKKKVIILPNGIDNFWIKNQRTDNQNKKKKIKIIQVGNIDKNKNIVTTIKVCKKLIRKGYEIELKVIGRLYLNSKVLEENFIKYIPFCRKEELLEYYRNSDIFLLPSKYETFGLVYAEALSQGLPIIYTRGQGFDGQIPDGEVGYSVTYNDVNEIVEKIERILMNYEYYSINTKKYLEKFNWEKISNSYIEIYEEIIK